MDLAGSGMGKVMDEERAGRIECVAVYKVDLSLSLLNLARMRAAFKHQAREFRFRDGAVQPGQQDRHRHRTWKASRCRRALWITAIAKLLWAA